MVNYQLGKIYKIVDNTNGNVYIGSTCEPTLARRLSNHVQDYKRREIRNNNTRSFQIIDNNNYDIILIENYPCERKDELHARERYYIEALECVNKQIPARTRKEFNIYNKVKQNMYNKTYYINNKETLLIKQSVQVLCPCGKQHTKNHKTRHEKSKFHQNYVNTSSTQP